MGATPADREETALYSLQATVYLTSVFISIAISRAFVFPLVYKFILSKRAPPQQEADHITTTGPSKSNAPKSPESIGTHLSRRHPTTIGAGTSKQKQQQRALNFNGTKASKPSPSKTKHYGLAMGEAESGEDEEDDLYDSSDELTARELRRLQQSPGFRTWCKQKNLNTGDLEQTSRRLRLYNTLKRVHPDSFWQLCSSQSKLGVETCAPSTAVLITEYLTSLLATMASLGICGYCWSCREEMSGIVTGVWLLLAWLLTSRQWIQSRPASGPQFGLWYEDLTWGHAAPAWRVIAASMLELLYALTSLGLGAAISIAQRCRREDRQTVAEKLMGIRVVKEMSVRLDVKQS